MLAHRELLPSVANQTCAWHPTTHLIAQALNLFCIGSQLAVELLERKAAVETSANASVERYRSARERMLSQSVTYHWSTMGTA